VEQSIFASLASHGLPGIVIFGLAAWIVMLHRELRDERSARIGDVKSYTDTLMAMQGKVLGAVDKLADVTTDLRDLVRDPRRRP
jgi:hypothetical protein